MLYILQVALEINNMKQVLIWQFQGVQIMSWWPKYLAYMMNLYSSSVFARFCSLRMNQYFIACSALILIMSIISGHAWNDERDRISITTSGSCSRYWVIRVYFYKMLLLQFLAYLVVIVGPGIVLNRCCETECSSCGNHMKTIGWVIANSPVLPKFI